MAVEVILQRQVNALDGCDRPIEDLALVDLFFRFQARHSAQAQTAMHQPEVFEEGAAQAHILILLERQNRREPHQQGQEKLAVNGLVRSQPVREGRSGAHGSVALILGLGERKLEAPLSNDAGLLLIRIEQQFGNQPDLLGWA